MYKAKGSVKQVLSPLTFEKKDGTSGNKARFILTTEAKYNPDVYFEVLSDKAKGDISNINVGDMVEVEFNLSSREYNGKYFHNVNAWKITKQEVVMQEVGSDEDPF